MKLALPLFKCLSKAVRINRFHLIFALFLPGQWVGRVPGVSLPRCSCGVAAERRGAGGNRRPPIHGQRCAMEPQHRLMRAGDHVSKGLAHLI